jgi:hypothetical protein
MPKQQPWKPTEGERVRVVGMPGYDNEYGTVIGRTGAGLCRVHMDRDGAVVGAESWNVRQLGALEVLAAEAPQNATPVQMALLDIRRKAQGAGGHSARAYYDAAAILERALKAQGLK